MSRSMSEVLETTPYLVVVNTEGGESAVYNRYYQLMFEGASQRLLAYAARWNTQVTRGFTLSQPEQQPSWFLPGAEEECVCYHLYKGTTPERELRSIPRR